MTQPAYQLHLKNKLLWIIAARTIQTNFISIDYNQDDNKFLHMLRKDFPLHYRRGKFCLPGSDIIKFTNFYRRPKKISAIAPVNRPSVLDCPEDDEKPYLISLLNESFWARGSR